MSPQFGDEGGVEDESDDSEGWRRVAERDPFGMEAAERSAVTSSSSLDDDDVMIADELDRMQEMAIAKRERAMRLAEKAKRGQAVEDDISMSSDSGERELLHSQDVLKQQGLYSCHTAGGPHADVMQSPCCSSHPFSIYVLVCGCSLHCAADRHHRLAMDVLTVDELQQRYLDDYRAYGDDGRLVRILAFISGFSNKLALLGRQILMGQAQLDSWRQEVKKTILHKKEGPTQMLLWNSQHLYHSPTHPAHAAAHTFP